jgi:hypothetical protein
VQYEGVIYNALVLALFYVENPGFMTCGFGYHPADVEHLVILSDDAGVNRHVYFGAHGAGEGTWKRWDECETDDGRLVAYMSPYSNAMYPAKGRYMRVGGIANDYCDGKGRVWIPEETEFEDATAQIWSDSHYQVKRGINTPKNISPPVGRSITSWERFLLFIPAIKKKVAGQKRLVWI